MSLIMHIESMVKIDTAHGSAVKLRANYKRYYEDCSIKSAYGDFALHYTGEGALYTQFLNYVTGDYSKLLFSTSVYAQSFTKGTIHISMKNVVDRLIKNYPTRVAVSDSCIIGAITAPVCSDSFSMYSGDQWVGEYFVVDVDKVGSSSVQCSVYIAGRLDQYTIPIEFFVRDCYSFETEAGVFTLKLKSMIPYQFAQFTECVISPGLTTTCYKKVLEDYIPQTPDELLPPVVEPPIVEPPVDEDVVYEAEPDDITIWLILGVAVIGMIVLTIRK